MFFHNDVHVHTSSYKKRGKLPALRGAEVRRPARDYGAASLPSAAAPSAGLPRACLPRASPCTSDQPAAELAESRCVVHIERGTHCASCALRVVRIAGAWCALRVMRIARRAHPLRIVRNAYDAQCASWCALRVRIAHGAHCAWCALRVVRIHCASLRGDAAGYG